MVIGGRSELTQKFPWNVDIIITNALLSVSRSSLVQYSITYGSGKVWIRGANDRWVRLNACPLEEDWPVADRVVDIFPETQVQLGLSARVHRSNALGRTSYTIEVTLLTPEWPGWHSDVFTGGTGDQKPVSEHGISKLGDS